MSSRSQTKSLDRDLQPTRRRRHAYPQNIQQVNNASEHLVCNLHNKIEAIFELYPVTRFEQELLGETLSNYMADVAKRVSIDTMVLAKLNQTIKAKMADRRLTEPHELIVVYLDFVLNCHNLFHGITNRLYHTIINGLLRYCVSLAKYCSTDIEFVVNYEKLIQKNEPDIMREVKDIEYQNKEFKRFTNSAQMVLVHAVDLIACIRKIRASINKLYYFVTEWVDEERNYPSNLSEEIKMIKSDLFTLEQKTSKDDKSIKQRQMKIATVDKQCKVMEKSYLLLKRKYFRIQQSQEQIMARLEELEGQSSSRTDELEHLKNKIKSLEYVRHRVDRRGKIPRYKISMEIRATKDEKSDYEAQYFRFEENKSALHRHRERLMKMSEELKEKMQSIKNQISDNEALILKLKENLQEDISAHEEDMVNLNRLQLKLKDLNFICSKKNSLDTIRQLYNHGRLEKSVGDVNLIDRMCELVATKMLKDWKELYIHLPMYPDRTIEQRCNDIDVIDKISARNDGTPRKQTRMCLNKWRLFYHNATTDHLIEGLRKSNHRDIAKELRLETIKSRNRFEDEDFSGTEEPVQAQTA